MNRPVIKFPTKCRALELACETANIDEPAQTTVDRAKTFLAFLDGESALPSDPLERLRHVAQAFADETGSAVYLDIRKGEGGNETRDATWIRPSS